MLFEGNAQYEIEQCSGIAEEVQTCLFNCYHTNVSCTWLWFQLWWMITAGSVYAATIPIRVLVGSCLATKVLNCLLLVDVDGHNYYHVYVGSVERKRVMGQQSSCETAFNHASFKSTYTSMHDALNFNYQPWHSCYCCVVSFTHSWCDGVICWYIIIINTWWQNNQFAVQ